MSSTPRETFAKMRALSEDKGASEQERETARAIMERYLNRYGAEVAIPEEEEETRVDFHGLESWEETLADHCGRFLGLRAFLLGKRLYVGTKRETFRVAKGSTRLAGPKTAVESAQALYLHHRPILEARMKLFANAYRYEAMPIEGSGSTDREMTPDEVAALRAGQRAGQAARMDKRLGSGE